ncbi:hypothetical protein SLEP1_g3784 [Rubroshorea leprosula]|uniref:Uncharacterized protein n=1 Tax=Rubroshorea leprosula TaxID=152421 RepID=A0AAV5HLM7_9ROSI|nr:hypothetical protein SLEP1_g3784 [Rubroshorea leprosula]
MVKFRTLCICGTLSQMHGSHKCTASVVSRIWVLRRDIGYC